MIRTNKIDPWFQNQPEKSFLQDLTSPYHAQKPDRFGVAGPMQGEINVSGLYVTGAIEDPLLETMITDFNHFLTLCDVKGDRFPLILKKEAVEGFESYRVEVTEASVTLTAGDSEGLRRGLVWIEDEMQRHEGPYLTLGTITRKPWLHTRITRCFFSPINRPPKFGDELTDDIDYYPEEYLNRLAHDGTNGVWIYSRFSDLITSSFIPSYGKGSASRIEKLNRVIAKCARYGIKVYLFAIEPVALPAEDAAQFPQVDGGIAYNGRHYFCVNTPEGRAFCEEAGERLMTLCPDLGGLISITYGERPTSCSSSFASLEASLLGGEMPDYVTGSTPIVCPRCKNLAPGKVVANAAEALRSGIRKVKPEALVISWTYGDRLFPFKDVKEYVQNAPDDVMLMQNFEELGLKEQLGRERIGVDYWLSYPGPSPLFAVTAEEAKRCHKHMFMKTQVCCSHELATVPYVPVPGLLFEKYKQAKAMGVEGVMQCWYFGNYPSFMSKAAGELAFCDSLSTEEEKNALLLSLAQIVWGRSKGATVVKAWQAFEEGYRNYPLNIMFSYYGPMHDGPVWNLALEPKNFSLPRSWQSLDPADGDRIGECMLKGHSLEEVLSLTSAISSHWAEGMEIMRTLTPTDHRQEQEFSVASALELLFASGSNIIRFYALRDQLGHNTEPRKQLDAMRRIVMEEMEHSARLAELCKADSRLGYHSEAEGYKFFPEKLESRIEQLKTLLSTEFPRVQQRILAKEAPLPYYLGQEPDASSYQMAKDSLEEASWEKVGDHAAFRAAYSEEELMLELQSDEPEEITLHPEFRLFFPEFPIHLYRGRLEIRQYNILYYGLIGDRLEQTLNMWQVQKLEGMCHYRLTLNRKEIGWQETLPLKMRIQIGDALWCKEENPVYTLGKESVSPLDHGWLMP